MLKNIIHITIVTFVLIVCVFNISFARLDPGGGTRPSSGGTRSSAGEIDTDYYVHDINSNEAKNTNEISKMGKLIIGIIRGAGVVISVIMLIIIGIKYMIGSVEEKATYKETLKPYLIGAIMLFGITNILPIIIQVAKAI